MSVFELDTIRRYIDQLSPDLRDRMPKSATEYGNNLMAMFMFGAANILASDEIPWDELGASPEVRKMFASAMQWDAAQLAAEETE